MTEFENLKRSYAAIIQFALAANIDHHEVKRGNELLHEVCKQFVDNSSYQNYEKTAMKQELELLKDTLSEEIKAYYQRK